MAHEVPAPDIDERDVEVQKRAAAGVTAVAVSMKRALTEMGPSRTAHVAQAQPAGRLRLHVVHLAGSRSGPPAHRRVLRERRQGRGSTGEDEGHKSRPQPAHLS